MRDVAPALARLGGALRAHGVATSLKDEVDAVEALAVVDREDRAEVHAALRIALKIPRAAAATFDRLFAAFFDGEPLPAPPRRARARTAAPSLPRGGALSWNADERRWDGPSSVTPEGDEPGYSPEALLRRKPFDAIAPSDAALAAMQDAVVRLARRLAARRSRRLVPTTGRGRPDLRSSFRRALATQGELVRLARRARDQDRPKLVFLCDTSGSMQTQAAFLLTFVLSLRRALPRCEVFAFNTELLHLSSVLGEKRLAVTLERLASAVPDWSGGTRIGASLAEFADAYLPRFVDSKTAVIVLSDGLDRGDPALFAEAVRRIRLAAKKVVWLSPLLGDTRYEPSTLGLAAALPYVDHFAAAHDLASLERALPELLD